MNKLNSSDLEGLFAKIKDIMIENKDWLFELDSVMGDGDLGLTMTNGFSKICETTFSYKEEKIGKLLIKAGMILAENVPSTMGTLIATGFMKAGKVSKDKIEIDLLDLVEMSSAFVEGIMKRGKTKLGEKTVVDSLYPAFEALKSASESNKSLKEAFRQAYEAANKGVEATKKMVSKHGRGVWYGKKSIGKKDPGAVAGMLLVKTFYEYIKEEKI